MSLNLQLSVAEGANGGRGREERKKSSYQGAGDKDSSAHFSSFMLCHLGQVTNPLGFILNIWEMWKIAQTNSYYKVVLRTKEVVSESFGHTKSLWILWNKTLRRKKTIVSFKKILEAFLNTVPFKEIWPPVLVNADNRLFLSLIQNQMSLPAVWRSKGKEKLWSHLNILLMQQRNQIYFLWPDDSKSSFAGLSNRLASLRAFRRKFYSLLTL